MPSDVISIDVVRDAIVTAAVGKDLLGFDLGSLDAIGDIEMAGRTVHLTVTLPVAAAHMRSQIEVELEEALADINWIRAVSVDWRPSVHGKPDRVDLLPNVKNIIAVSSGKGGVGKSTVAANLAAGLADMGLRVGLLDADIYGPNAPTLLGATEGTPQTTENGLILPRRANGVKLMSMDFIVGDDDPIIWRGPMVDDILQQLTGDVAWGKLDFLIVDLPPGTGDAQLTLVQHLPVTGIVIVTTPQVVAVDDARRGLKGFAKYSVPILGIVENMSVFICPDCRSEHTIFGSGGADSLANAFDLPVLGRLLLDPSVGTVQSQGTEDPGLEVPVFGRLSLPRTEEERTERIPPYVLRAPDSGQSRFREMVTMVAVHCQAAVS
jgi:ATP-binding protein involved in chromosome partitioning